MRDRYCDPSHLGKGERAKGKRGKGIMESILEGEGKFLVCLIERSHVVEKFLVCLIERSHAVVEDSSCWFHRKIPCSSQRFSLSVSWHGSTQPPKIFLFCPMESAHVAVKDFPYLSPSSIPGSNPRFTLFPFPFSLSPRSAPML